jgi:hypothetical protein
MGDLNPAPMIRARPLPVSTADSMLSAMFGPGAAGPGDVVPVLDRDSAADIALPRRVCPCRSVDGDRERWVVSV